MNEGRVLPGGGGGAGQTIEPSMVSCENYYYRLLDYIYFIRKRLFVFCLLR